jgi:HAD superfamily hydrolase (TIGR01450 family)
MMTPFALPLPNHLAPERGRRTLMEWAADPRRRFIVDLDGTLIRSGRAIGDAARFLALAGSRAVIASNNSDATGAELALRMARLGLNVDAGRIVLAGMEAAALAAERFPGGRILPVAAPGLVAEARRLGMAPVRSEEAARCGANVVLLGRDVRFSYRRLASAANAVRAGAALIVCNPDPTHPGPGGDVVPETGALLSALLACVGNIDYVVVGKPEPPLFRRALSILGAGEDVLVIGDNPNTDGAAAARTGLPFLQIDPNVGIDLAARPLVR